MNYSVIRFWTAFIFGMLFDLCYQSSFLGHWYIFSDDQSKTNPVSKMLLILGSAQRCCLHCRFGYSGQETLWTPWSIHCGCCDHGFGSRGYSLYISKPCWTQTLTLYEYSRVRCRFPISEETQTLVSVAKYASMVLILMWFFKQPKDVTLHNRIFLVTFKTSDSQWCPTKW